jgi:hypothetical protein
MKNLLKITLFIALLKIASYGETGEQVANPHATISYNPIENKVIAEDTSICPDCLESNCIYKEIDDNCGDGTDTDVQKAVLKVCKKGVLKIKKILIPY